MCLFHIAIRKERISSTDLVREYVEKAHAWMGQRLQSMEESIF